MKAAKNLFITGVSSGFGWALAMEAIAQGHHVIGTVRNESTLASFEALSPERAHGVVLDVTDFDAMVAAVEAQHGAVDVLINNAGYGHGGILEKSSLEEMRRQLDVNLVNAVALIKAFLLYFCQRRAGHIINIT